MSCSTDMQLVYCCNIRAERDVSPEVRRAFSEAQFGLPFVSLKFRNYHWQLARRNYLPVVRLFSDLSWLR